MKFADQLRNSVKAYHEGIDEDAIASIKENCAESAKKGESYDYTKLPLTEATIKTLETREGLKVTKVTTSYFSYRIEW